MIVPLAEPERTREPDCVPSCPGGVLLDKGYRKLPPGRPDPLWSGQSRGPRTGRM